MIYYTDMIKACNALAIKQKRKLNLKYLRFLNKFKRKIINFSKAKYDIEKIDGEEFIIIKLSSFLTRSTHDNFMYIDTVNKSAAYRLFKIWLYKNSNIKSCYLCTDSVGGYMVDRSKTVPSSGPRM